MAEIVYAAAVSFIIALVIGPVSINYLRRLKFGQTIREEGPKEHLKKQGTPTMGGIIMIVALTAGTLLFAPSLSTVAWALFITLGYGLIGLLDDFIIIVTKRSMGLKARQKLAGQVILALVISLYAYVDPKIGTEVIVPWGRGLLDLGPFFVPIAAFIVVGTSNAVNLTDGLDGLAAGTAGIAGVTFAVMMYLAGHTDLAVFAGALAGACLGFSWFNTHPAQVFMGDTGSLALGGALAGLALLSKTMFFLLPIGGIFVMETLSVMIQVTSFKLTKKRVFKMSPIHHHFELVGWKETKIVVRFWIIGLILAFTGIAMYLHAVRI